MEIAVHFCNSYSCHMKVLNAYRRSMDSCSLTYLEAFPYPRWDPTVGTQVDHLYPISVDHYCWMNLYP